MLLGLSAVEVDAADIDSIGPALHAAMRAWLQGEAMQEPVSIWFEQVVPYPLVDDSAIAQLLADWQWSPDKRVVWLGESPVCQAGDWLIGDECGEVLALTADSAHLLQRACPGPEWQAPRAMDYPSEVLAAFHEAGLVCV
jgi:hypothetical protein